MLALVSAMKLKYYFFGSMLDELAFYAFNSCVI